MNYIEISNECLEEMKANGSSPIMVGGEIQNATPVDSDVTFWGKSHRKFHVIGELKELDIALVVRTDSYSQLEMATAFNPSI